MSLSLATVRQAGAVDSTWNGTTSDWADPANWTAGVPDGIATFGPAGSATIDSNGFVDVGAIRFTAQPNVPNYAINNNVDVFQISGAGIFNESGNVQTFNIFGSGLSFINSSTASGGPTVVNIFNGTYLDFLNSSTAGSAVISNIGGVSFTDSSTADQAVIIHAADFAGLSFSGSSSAGNATILSAPGVIGTSIFFEDTSTAGNATIYNPPVGFTLFGGGASAGNAHIFNEGSETLGPSFTGFFGNSTAGNATITNTFGGVTFLDASVAGTATIVNNATGLTLFGGAASADHANIVNEAGTGGVGTGGYTTFVDTSTAANATITTRNGGLVAFFDASSGGAARFITEAGGVFDISQLTAPGTTAGSIEGAGAYYLGSRQLTVGSTNLSTEVSGVISDGTCGCFGPVTETGGSLVKVGTGTLTLTGANTYSGGTTIAAGTLQIGNGGTTGTAGFGAIVNDAILAFNRSDLLIFDNTITGTGAVNQIGSGTTVLTAANSYTGPTIISAGQLTIALGASIASNVTNNAGFANSGTVNGSVTNNGTFAQSAGSVSGGVINTGIVHADGGTLNGAIVNNGGTFNVGGTVTGDGSFNNATGATLAIAGAANYTLGGLLTNAGAVTVAGTGTLDASAGGVSNLAGGTITVAFGGMLRDDLANAGTVTNNGLYVANVASNSGSIFNDGTWTGNVASSTGTIANTSIWTGTITTSGNFTNAAGASVSGLLGVTGGTALNDGALNGGVQLSGGILTGTGSVAGLVATGGTLAPGGGVAGASMTIAGYLSLTSGVQYVVGLDPSTASFANVTGAATLGGATVYATYASGNYVSRRYTILNAAGRISGTFDGPVNTNLPTNFHATLAYDPTHAYLDLALNFVVPGGLNRNQQNVGDALTGFFNRTGGIPLVFGALSPAALTQASGETATGMQQTTFDAMNLFLGLLTDPFVAGRQPSPAASAFAGIDDGANAFAARRGRTGAERDAYGMITKAVPRAATFEARWNVWAAGFGGSQQTDGNAALGAGGTTSQIYGGAVGADYWFSPQTVAGFALAGGGTQFGVADAGTGKSDLFQAGGFIRHTEGRAHITGALAYGWQDITTDRVVTVAGIDRLRARFNANAYSGRVEGGYRLANPWLAIMPYAAGQFTTLELPSYAESVVSGANTFALGYAGKSVTAPRSEVGLRSDKSWALGDGVFTLRGRAAWAHDFNPDRNAQATFQTLPGASFVLNGAPRARDAALTTGAAEWTFASGLALAAIFEGEFSDVTRSYAGKGIARYSW